MRAVPDAHALIWWFNGSPRLSANALSVLAGDETELLLSPVSVWEIGIKHAIGKLPEASDFLAKMPNLALDLGLTEIPVSSEDGLRAAALPLHHRDPLDRMLVAQAMRTVAVLLSKDRRLDAYGIERIW